MKRENNKIKDAIAKHKLSESMAMCGQQYRTNNRCCFVGCTYLGTVFVRWKMWVQPCAPKEGPWPRFLLPKSRVSKSETNSWGKSSSSGRKANCSRIAAAPSTLHCANRRAGWIRFAEDAQSPEPKPLAQEVAWESGRLLESAGTFLLYLPTLTGAG